MMRLFLLTVLLSACSTIQKYDQIDISKNSEKQAFKGQRMFRISKLEDLPNAFGKKDIWGGKVDKGFIEVYYAGKNNSYIYLEILDQDVKTNANVFTRYQKSTATYSESKYQSGNYSNTNGTLHFNKAPEETRDYLPSNRYQVKLNWPKESKFDFNSLQLNILDASEDKITFSVQDKPTHIRSLSSK